MKRIFDVLLATLLLVLVALPAALIAAIIWLTQGAPVIYWSRRIGRNDVEFLMPKFRTMRRDTPAVATHLLADPTNWVTPLGKFLRRSSLDELPQIWSVLRGDMSIVGPRPALFNQEDLRALRCETGVHRLRPGITGWAQVNGRDELSIEEKVRFDREYLAKQSLLFDARILIRTLTQVLSGKAVSH